MWSNLIDFLWTWSGYALLGSLGAIIPLATALFWQLLQRWLDRKYADDLPESAGAFTRRCAARTWSEAPPTVVCIPKKHPLAKVGDGYSPAQHTVLLSEQTFFKRDPTFWAIGAHELGHAMLYQKASWFMNLAMVARKLNPLVATFAFTVFLSNIFLASETVLSTALGLYWCVVGMGVFICLDELAASVVAIRLLKQDGRLRKDHWVGVYSALGAALMTYVGAAMGALVVVILYDQFATASLTQDPMVIAPPLTGGWLMVCAGLCVAVLGVGVMNLFNLLGSSDRFDPGLEVTNQQMEEANQAIKRLENLKGPEVDAQRARLDKEMARYIKRAALRAVKAIVDYTAMCGLLWWAWDQSAEGFWLVCVAIAVHRIHVLYGILLIPPTIILVLAFGIVLLPILIPVVLWLTRLDKDLASDDRQRQPDAMDVTQEAAQTREKLGTWKLKWDLAARLARFPELVHLPMAVCFLWLAFGQG